MNFNLPVVIRQHCSLLLTIRIVSLIIYLIVLSVDIYFYPKRFELK